jgi:uroporphyrinogen decarboxylase
MKKVVDNIKIPKLFHCDGTVEPVIEDLIELGFNGLHPVDPTAMDIEKVKERWGNKICLVGNIDLSYTLVRGTPEEVEEEVKNRIEKIGYNGGYILSSANSITSYCPTENILAMRDALLKYGAI